MTDRDIARNAGIKSAKLESQGQLNIFNQSSAKAAIAPETAKKVERANKFERNLKAKANARFTQRTTTKEGKTLIPDGYRDAIKESANSDTVRSQVRNLKTAARTLKGKKKTLRNRYDNPIKRSKKTLARQKQESTGQASLF
jgi:hypothetical protein